MTDQQKKIAAGSAFAVLAALILYFELSDSSAPTPPPSAPVSTTSRPNTTTLNPASNPAQTGAQTAQTGAHTPPLNPAQAAIQTAAQLDPTLYLGPMLATEALRYTGTGRNIFSSSTPVVRAALPQPRFPVRPTPIPIAYTPPRPTGPPPPPPINLKFFGTATHAGGQRQAFLLRGEDVFLAYPGDIVQRRYKIDTVSANSVLVTDLTNNNQQSLPLQPN